MSNEPSVIEVNHLVHKYGRTEAVNDLSLRVRRGQCYGFFGRNGAGKTTTIKCLLNLLRPKSGHGARLRPGPGQGGGRGQVAAGVCAGQRGVLPVDDRAQRAGLPGLLPAALEPRTERELLGQFRLDDAKKASALSRGQKTQLALMGAICAEPELLVLDEPTSGLDPIVRREFIQTVIGAYQEADPGNRTVFVSTHLISEFEGLIDEFTIIENGRAELTLGADEARVPLQEDPRALCDGGAGGRVPGGPAYPARGPGAGTDGQRPFGRDPAPAPVPGARRS